MKKQERQNEEKLLERKKIKFLKVVLDSSKHLGVITPEVKFWDGYCPDDDGDEIAHIHPDIYLICMPLNNLKNMDFEEIEETATHEVTHLIKKGHDDSFYKIHSEVETEIWQPEGAGIIKITENPYIEDKKIHKNSIKIIKNKCNYYICGKKTKGIKCNYCSSYFCKNHIKPRKVEISSKFDFEDEKYTHPCLAYTHFIINEKENKEEEYNLALQKLLMKKSRNNTEDYVTSTSNPLIKEKKSEFYVDEKYKKEYVGNIGHQEDKKLNKYLKKLYQKFLNKFTKTIK